MDENELIEALRALPRTSPSAAFSDGVLRRIREGARPRRSVPWRASALLAAAAVAGAGWVREHHRQEARALREETRAIAREIEGMKRTLPSPLIDLGEKDGIRYVFDLRRPPVSRGGTL